MFGLVSLRDRLIAWVCMLAGACLLRGTQSRTTYRVHFFHTGPHYAYKEGLWHLDRSPMPVPPPRAWLQSRALMASPTPLLAAARQAELWDYPDLCLRTFIVQGLREGFRIGYTASWRQLRSARRNIPSYEHPKVADKYLHYPTIDIGIERILTVDPGAQLSKLDIKDAYHIVSVHPDDWPMLGMQWKDTFLWIPACPSARDQCKSSSQLWPMPRNGSSRPRG